MPTAHYVNRHGTRITVIGLKHYASAGFWSSLQAELDALPNDTVIHFEKPVSDRSTWSRLTRIKAAIGDRIDHGNKVIGLAGGLTFQFDELVIGEDWENHDLSTSHILSAYSVWLLIPMAVWCAVEAATPAIARVCGRALVRSLVANAGEKPSLRRLIKVRIILGERNAVAADAALASQSDVVMLWGHAHLDGIGARLEEQDFQLERVTWRTLLVVGG